MMKEIKLIRVDDRLIHAQIIIFWLKKININTIYIVDDDLAENKFLCQIYRLTTPPHVRIKIFTVNQVAEYINKRTNIPPTARILILTKSLKTVVSLHKINFPIDTIQIGGNLLESGLNKKQIIDQLFNRFSTEISYLLDHSIYIYCQNTTDGEKIIITKEQIKLLNQEQQDFQAL